MGKDDWYFAVSTLLAILALLGTDWNILQQRIAMSDKVRHRLALGLILSSLALSSLGWYRLRELQAKIPSSDGEITIYRENALYKTVQGKKFINETVPIDDFRYVNCE